MEVETEMSSWQLSAKKHRAWLAAIQPGDKGVVAHRWVGKSVLTITRLTKTQIIAANSRGVEYRFRRDTGSTVGGGHESLGEYTPEVRQELELARLRKWLADDLPKEKFTLEQLRSLYVAVKEIAGQQESAQIGTPTL